MLIRFSNRLAAQPCSLDTQIGQDHIVRCTMTGAEMIWSPTEPGSLDSAIDEHHAAHDRAEDGRAYRREAAVRFAQARQIYRTTEPGHSSRRGIAQYL